MTTEPNTLSIISHVVHYASNDQLFAYGPYAREIDIWADLFPRVIIAAPCRYETPPGDCLPFTRSNIFIEPQKETGGETLRAKLKQIVSLPTLAWRLVRTMRRADAVHVRCPGNLGLLGVILAPLFSRHLIAKYAGQWSQYSGEPWSFRLQKKILRSGWWRGPVTVYGRNSDQTPNIIPFFTSVLTTEQMERAKTAATTKTFRSPLHVLYVGRLSAPKNVDVLISAVASLKAEAIEIQCAIVGEGPERPALAAQVAEMDLGDCISFAGGLAFERVIDFYERADVLVLASETEGWPKAITEGMAFGLICIGSNRGLVPEILGDERGVLVPPRNLEALTVAIRRIATSPGEYQAVSAQAALWAQKYSLEDLRRSLGELLTRCWGIPADRFSSN
jgi:glycosyltransferase involved in cell wall biosynthesis